MVKVTVPITIARVPDDVRRLVDEREQARAQKDFAKSDQLRQQIKGLGYMVNDKNGAYELLKIGDQDQKAAKSYLVLFGSGENAPSAVDTYRQLFLSLGKRDLKISLITTPAGFQPNVEHVYQEIKDYLLASLPDFNLSINIVYANTQHDANNPEIVSQIDDSDIIFTGPGSPTYAVKHLQGSVLCNKITEKVKNGATLILASAATIAFSHHCLPVYEIYKVGEDLHWQNGLDFYRHIWQSATIIPHFNNTEGGAHLDTSHCFVGKSRFDKLKSQLPDSEWILGLDEHTAYIVDLATKESVVKGKGHAQQI